jgi:hypothetical protein
MASIMRPGVPNDSYPNGWGFSFGPGGAEGNTPSPHGMSNPFGMAPMEHFDASTRNFNTGVTTSNWSSINANFVQAFSSRFPKDSVTSEMLVFVERGRLSPQLRLPIDHEIASIHELNRYLISPEGRNKYGKHASCEKLMDDFAFAGVYNAAIPGHVKDTDDWDAAIVVGRRARCAAITRAHSAKAEALTDRLMNTVHLLVVRRKLVDGDLFGLASDVGKDEYYWGFYMHVSESEAAPPDWLYKDDVSQGTVIRVGHIIEFTPSNNTDPVKTTRARNAISGKHNLLTKDKDYMNLVPLLPTVDIALM